VRVLSSAFAINSKPKVKIPANTACLFIMRSLYLVRG
jgi:hypothetical protein